jgi:hypothetical protein
MHRTPVRRRGRLYVVTLAATLLLALAVEPASAGRFSISNTRFRITWASLLIFRDETGMSPSVNCPVTLEGSFHSATIRKTIGALIGGVTRGILKNESCVNGRATILQESLPWHVNYDGFEGTLPAITSLHIGVRNYALRTEFTAFGVNCLYLDNGTAEENLMFRLAAGAAGQLTNAIPDGGRHLPKKAGENIFCPVFTKLSGEGQTTLLGAATRISITLI